MYEKAPRPKTLLSLLAFIAGFIGLFLSLLGPAGILFGLVGVVLGIIASRSQPAARGMWRTGIILAVIAILIGTGIIVLHVTVLRG